MRGRVSRRGQSGEGREPRDSLQMYYSKGEIIAGLWFHLILLLLTACFRRESGFPPRVLTCYRFEKRGACSIVKRIKEESPACCLPVNHVCVVSVCCCCCV